ncbi:MAG TPA: hypothetical protein VFV34_23085 [Blastocatellia bacterium]|nr:hypothetical protein [Blastocatellia bacterium]
MKRVILFLFVLAAGFGLVQGTRAQTSDKILGKYRKAIGGKAVARIRSTTVTGAFNNGDQAGAGRFTLTTAAPDQVRLDLEGPGLVLSECYNGKSAWVRDHKGLRTLLGREAKGLRLWAVLSNSRLRDLGRVRVFAQKVTAGSVGGKPASAVDFTFNDVSAKLFFDNSTGLLIKQERETAAGVEEILFDDYRRVDGVMEPFSIVVRRPDLNIAVVIEKVEHNTVADQARFRYPVMPGQRPLPDLESLMKSVESNQERLEELREQYTFRELETENKLDGNGRTKETVVRAYDVTPVAGNFVKRLISEDGKELSASDREKEDKRVQKEVEEALKRREKERDRKERDKDKDQSKDKDNDDDDITILTFLRISEITSVRREQFRGQEVIAFDFEPKKGYKPRNRAETIVSKLAGTVWVDEDAREIARLEARLIDSFKLGGGVLASIRPSTAFVFEQEKVDAEIWLPSYAEVNISARVLLFAKLNRSATLRYSDYKKHHVDSDYKLEKPKSDSRP